MAGQPRGSFQRFLLTCLLEGPCCVTLHIPKPETRRVGLVYILRRKMKTQEAELLRTKVSNSVSMCPWSRIFQGIHSTGEGNGLLIKNKTHTHSFFRTS